jgi:ribonuclease HI
MVMELRCGRTAIQATRRAGSRRALPRTRTRHRRSLPPTTRHVRFEMRRHAPPSYHRAINANVSGARRIGLAEAALIRRAKRAQERLRFALSPTNTRSLRKAATTTPPKSDPDDEEADRYIRSLRTLTGGEACRQPRLRRQALRYSRAYKRWLEGWETPSGRTTYGEAPQLCTPRADLQNAWMPASLKGGGGNGANRGRQDQRGQSPNRQPQQQQRGRRSSPAQQNTSAPSKQERWRSVSRRRNSSTGGRSNSATAGQRRNNDGDGQQTLNKERQVCPAYLAETCVRGAECPWSHDLRFIPLPLEQARAALRNGLGIKVGDTAPVIAGPTTGEPKGPKWIDLSRCDPHELKMSRQAIAFFEGTEAVYREGVGQRAKIFGAKSRGLKEAGMTRVNLNTLFLCDVDGCKCVAPAAQMLEHDKTHPSSDARRATLAAACPVPPTSTKKAEPPTSTVTARAPVSAAQSPVSAAPPATKIVQVSSQPVQQRAASAFNRIAPAHVAEAAGQLPQVGNLCAITVAARLAAALTLVAEDSTGHPVSALVLAALFEPSDVVANNLADALKVPRDTGGENLQSVFGRLILALATEGSCHPSQILPYYRESWCTICSVSEVRQTGWTVLSQVRLVGEVTSLTTYADAHLEMCTSCNAQKVLLDHMGPAGEDDVGKVLAVALMEQHSPEGRIVGPWASDVPDLVYSASAEMEVLAIGMGSVDRNHYEALYRPSRDKAFLHLDKEVERPNNWVAAVLIVRVTAVRPHTDPERFVCDTPNSVILGGDTYSPSNEAVPIAAPLDTATIRHSRYRPGKRGPAPIVTPAPGPVFDELPQPMGNFALPPKTNAFWSAGHASVFAGVGRATKARGPTSADSVTNLEPDPAHPEHPTEVPTDEPDARPPATPAARKSAFAPTSSTGATPPASGTFKSAFSHSPPAQAGQSSGSAWPLPRSGSEVPNQSQAREGSAPYKTAFNTAGPAWASPKLQGRGPSPQPTRLAHSPSTAPPPPPIPLPPIDVVIATTNFNSGVHADGLIANLTALRDADIIVIAEPGVFALPPSLLEACFSPYNVLRTARATGPAHRGGVAVLIKKQLGFSPVQLPTSTVSENCGLTLLAPDGLPLLYIVGCYATCTDESADRVSLVIESIKQCLSLNPHPHVPSLLAGDLNARHVSLGDHSSNIRGNRLVREILMEQWQAVTAPSHKDGGCLDIFLATPTLPISAPCVRTMLNTDHHALLVHICTTPDSRRNAAYYTNALHIPSGFAKDARFIPTLDNALLGRGGTIHCKENRLFHALLKALTVCGARKTRRRIALTPTPPTIEQLQAAAKASPWRAISLLRRPAACLDQPFPLSSLVEVFGSRGKQRTHENVTPLTRFTPSDAMLIPPVSPEEIIAAIQANRTSACPDDHGLDALVLRAASLSPLFLERFAELLTCCLQQGQIPSRWATSTVSPIPKPGKPSGCLTSLRPVYLCSILAKTADRIFCWRMQAHWAPHPHQLGYRKGIPMEIVPLALVESCVPALSPATSHPDRHLTRAILLAVDLTDAFPSTSARAILDGYASTGDIPPYLLAIKTAMLTSRVMSVKYHGKYSHPDNIVDGTNQGFVSASCDFSAFSSSLLVRLEAWRSQARSTQRSFGMVADDLSAVICCSAPTLAEVQSSLRAAGQSFLTVVNSWAADHMISISTKTAALYISPPHSKTEAWAPRPLKCGPLDLTPATHGAIKVLGFTIDSHLSCHQAIEHVKHRHDAALIAMLPIFHRISLEDRRAIYESLALSHISRLAPILLSLGVASEDPRWTRLDTIIASGARLVTGATRTASSILTILEAGLLDARSLAIKESARLATKLTAIGNKLQSPVLRDALQFLRRAKLFNTTRSIEGVVVDRPISHPTLYALANRLHIISQPLHHPAELAIIRRDDDDIEVRAVKYAANLRALERIPDGSHVITTDGSVIHKQSSYGGGAATLYIALPHAILMDHRRDIMEDYAVRIPTGRHACSFSAEVSGLQGAVRLLQAATHAIHPADNVVILTDSQSILTALETGIMRQTHDQLSSLLHHLLSYTQTQGVHITLQFIYGHTDINVADRADHYAAEAAQTALRTGGNDTPIWHKDIARVATTLTITKHLTRLVADTFRRKAGPKGPAPWPTKWRARTFATMPDKHKIMLCQLRTDACPALGGHLYGQRVKCARCGTMTQRGGSQSMVEHIFKCSATFTSRRQSRVRGLFDLWKRPTRVITFVMKHYIEWHRPPMYATDPP